MAKSIGREKEELLVIAKIRQIFDNAEVIKQFHIEIDGGVGMATRIEYTVSEILVDEGEKKKICLNEGG